MQQHQFGQLGQVSTLTLGGGGLGMLWGPTTFDECVATVHAAVEAGITLLDLAPRYGDGKAEEVVGEAFGGTLPAGVRVTSKCNLGNPPAGGDRGDPAPLDRGQPATPAPVAARPVLPALERRAGRGVRGGMGRRRQPHDALSGVRRARPAGVRAAGGRGTDRRLGADRHRPSRHDHPAAGRAPRASRGAVHRQPAGLARRAEVLRRPGEAARDHGGGACQRGRRDGHPRGAGRRADRGDRPAAAGRPSRGARLRACRRASAACAPSWARTRP